MSQNGILHETPDVIYSLSLWIHHSLLSSSSWPKEAYRGHSEQLSYLVKGSLAQGLQH